MSESSFHLDFHALRNGQVGVSAVYGAFLTEAASSCLHFHQHKNPTPLSITGDRITTGTLAWCGGRELEQATWADLHEATEYGAYAIGIVVALQFTQKSRVERSVRGTGIDYWISDGENQDGPFQRAARLEISGMLKGNEARVAARLKEKVLQTQRSDGNGLPTYVSVVDFGQPEARFAQAKGGSRP
jgi:hypothetical protein